MRALALSLLLTLLDARAQASDTSPISLNLWEGNPPGMVAGAGPGADDGTGRFRNVGIPGMLVYLPAIHSRDGGDPAMIVCPGGGYSHLTRLTGADGAVDAFLPEGFAIVSLKYRTNPPSTSVYADALQDGLRAVRLVRVHAREWGINPNKIGMLGWSAGANLALNVATHFDNGLPGASDTVDHATSRPDFVVLLSPWPSSRPATDFPVGPKAPSAFIGSAKDDKTAPPAFAQAVADGYTAAKIPAMFWLIDSGGHGAFTINTPGEGGHWISKFLPWFSTIFPAKGT